MSAPFRFDLVVRNGTLVIPGVGTVAADVGICGGSYRRPRRRRSPDRRSDVLDAGGKVVLPGIFDPHIHIGNERSFEEEARDAKPARRFSAASPRSGSCCAASKTRISCIFRRSAARWTRRSFVDSVFHLQIFTEQQIAEMPDYARQYGIRSFKFYMSGMPGIVNSVTDDVLLAGFRQVASIGTDASPACIARPER